MIAKPKTGKEAARTADPVFAAIAEHKALNKELNRIDGIYRTARTKAEKERGWQGGKGGKLIKILSESA
jgi:hypothetical protein